MPPTWVWGLWITYGYMWITLEFLQRHARDPCDIKHITHAPHIETNPCKINTLSVLSAIMSTITSTKGSQMNLDEFKAHVLATRQASKAEAMSVLSATMSVSTTTKEGATNGN